MRIRTSCGIVTPLPPDLRLQPDAIRTRALSRHKLPLPIMGTTSSSPYPVQARLVFADTSVHNNTAISTELGIRYLISSPSRLFKSSRTTTISRSDARNGGGSFVVAEWEQNSFSKDRMQVVGMMSEMIPVNHAFPRTSGVFGKPCVFGFFFASFLGRC